MMESPRKFNDCYFYYYSTCTKGDNCIFRHEPAALGCETMCTHWQQGKCLDQRCKFRHMELRKNRKQIPCYWENQPGGCRKKHCPFQHKNPEARTDGIAPSQPQSPQQALPVGPQATIPREAGEGSPIVLPHELIWQQQQQRQDSAILGVLPATGDMLGHPVAGQRRVMAPHALHDAPAPPAYAALPVDSLVVNFEEESDSESISNMTPTKNVSPEMSVTRIVTSKMSELLQLERIQEEAAAYYSYDCDGILLASEFQSKLPGNYESLSLDELSGRKPLKKASKRTLDFKVMTLDEIRAKKKKICSDKSEKHSPINLESNKKSLKRKMSNTAEIDDESLKQCLKTISTNMVSKKLKRFRKPESNNEIKDNKPKLLRLKRDKVVVIKNVEDGALDSDNEIDEDVLLMDNDEGVEGFTIDDSEIKDNEDMLLGAGKSEFNIPDVVASCNERSVSVYKNDDEGRTIDSIDAVYDKPLW